MSDPKIYTPADVQTALKERLQKFEIQLKELHARELRKDEHMEPGVHEAAGAPGGQHVEPGGHENAVMPMPQSPAEQPVGSSHGIPAGQLSDLCPMCGQPDMPGQCTCLNGGGHEAMDPGIIDPAAHGVPATPLALNETQGYGPGAGPLAQSECEHGSECKGCVKKGYDFIDVKGKLGTKGNHPDAKLPGEKSKKIKSQDDNKVKANGKGLAKAGPPMAKPPSGGPAGAVAPPPAAKAAAPKVAGPAGGPKVMGKGEDKPRAVQEKPKPPVKLHVQPDSERKSEMELGKAAMPMAGAAAKMAGLHAAVDSFKASAGAAAAGGPAKPMPSAAAHAGRAAAFGAAAAGDFQPKGPINSGLELASKPKPAAPGRLVAKNELSKSMGVCLFCGNGEHGGSCGLAKNIQTSLAKVASPLFTAPPKVKPAAQGLGHVSNDAQEKTTVNGPAGAPTKATPIRAAAQAPTKMAAPNRLIAKGEIKPKKKPLPPKGK